MSCRIILITNNSLFKTRVEKIEYLQGSSWEVLVKGRDLIHGGSCLLNHPLYGNFRPYQQPYRSLLLQKKEDVPSTSNTAMNNLDLSSLELIENALSVYRSCLDRLLLPGKLSQEAEQDCREMDFELLRLTLDKYDLLDYGSGRF